MLKRYGPKQGFLRRLSLVMTAVLVLPLSLLAAFSLSSDFAQLSERAALISAMVNMPAGSLALLEERFRGQLDNRRPSNAASSSPEVSPAPTPEAQSPENQHAPGQPDTENSKPNVRGPARAPSAAKDTPAPIPREYRGTILQENMSGSGTGLLRFGEGLLRNYTKVPDEQVTSIMQQGMNLRLKDTDAPQVLIVHTHATESFEPFDSEHYDTRNTWRSTDNSKNMVAVGNVMEKQLRDAGIGVVHDTTQHDYPSYNGSYERSAKTIKKYLEQYPTIQIVLDLHRDGIQRDKNLIVKPVVEINGKKAAQLMIITGSDDGTMNVPNWRENLRFAAAVQDAIEQDYPHLTRPIFFCYRKYNMDLTTGSLLFEMGANANTLEESLYTAELVGKSLARLLSENKELKGE